MRDAERKPKKDAGAANPVAAELTDEELGGVQGGTGQGRIGTPDHGRERGVEGITINPINDPPTLSTKQ